MASPWKKRRREKVTSSLFAEVGEQFCLPLTISQSCSIGLGTLEVKLTPGVAWDEVSPPEKIGEHRGEIQQISALEEPLSLLWDGPSTLCMTPHFTGRSWSVPGRETACRGSWVVKAESRLVFSAFLLLFLVAASLAHCKAQPLPPCTWSPVVRGDRSCRRSRVFWCLRDTHHGPLGMISATFTWPVPYLEAGMPPVPREALSHGDLDSCLNIPPCFYYFWRPSKGVKHVSLTPAEIQQISLVFRKCVFVPVG